MPALQNYDILLDLTNDMHDPVSIQLLRDYGRQTSRIVLLLPTESLSLILESGSSYQYAVKFRTKVANVTQRKIMERHKLLNFPNFHGNFDRITVLKCFPSTERSERRSPLEGPQMQCVERNMMSLRYKIPEYLPHASIAP